MTGMTILITGGTDGIGLGTAVALARRGDSVLVVGRDHVKGERAAAGLRAVGAGEGTGFLAADLSALSAVQTLAERVRASVPNLNALVNNAAVFTPRRVATVDGLESMFATNVLAPFLLTHLLGETLHAATPATVLMVTAPATTPPDLDDLQGERDFSALRQFGRTKSADLLLTFALARRADITGVTANAVHPGITRTGLMRQANPAIRALTRISGTSPAKAGAEVAALLSEGAAFTANGSFFHHGRVIAPPASSRDEALQERLWSAMRTLTRT